MGEYAAAKTSVWWDIENCAVPRSCDPQLLVQNMSSALAAAGYSGPISISAYGDTNGIAHHVQQALSSTGISLNHVPAGIKDASDKKILVDMLIWAIDNPPPANYLLISGDRDFSNALYKLKMRRYNILLAQPPNVSQTLTTVAKSVWLWKSLVDGKPPLLQSPYVSSTPRGKKDGLDKSKNIVSGLSDTTPPSSPQVQNSVPCDHKESGNGKATGPSNGLPASGGVKKKSRSCLRKSSLIYQGKMCYMCGADHKASECVRPVPGQGVMCFKCGADHKAYECSWTGPCKHCGVRGHMGCVCPQNPASIIKWCESVSTSAPAGSPNKSIKASKAAAAAQPSSLLCPSPGQRAPTVPSAPSQLPGLQAPTTTASAPAASSHGSVQASKAVAAEHPTSCASVASPGSFQAFKAVATAQPSLGLGSPQVLCRPTVPAQAPQMFYTMPTTIFSSAPAASSHGSVEAWKAAAQSSAFWGTFFQGFYRPAIPPQLTASLGSCTFPTATPASRPNGKDVQ